MHQFLARPWLTITVAAVGIIASYAAVTYHNGSLQAANGGYCPAKRVCLEDGTCSGPNCPHCNKKV